MKKYLPALVAILLGLASFLAYIWNGSYVASDGTLVESFGFIPVGWLCFFVGVGLAGYAFFSKEK